MSDVEIKVRRFNGDWGLQAGLEAMAKKGWTAKEINTRKAALSALAGPFTRKQVHTVTFVRPSPQAVQAEQAAMTVQAQEAAMAVQTQQLAVEAKRERIRAAEAEQARQAIAAGLVTPEQARQIDENVQRERRW